MIATLMRLSQLARRRGASLLAARPYPTRATVGGRLVPGTGLAPWTNGFEGDNHAPAPTTWFCTIKRPAQLLTVRST